MVTSNKLPDKKVVKMVEQNNSVVLPQKTLLGEVNEHVTCPLCRGYYIDATTIVECLHSFCRSCIIKHLQIKSYCPVCEMMINSAKPNIKLDKALQDIVYKLVPGLFQREMERRQTFYASRPGQAASVTPEQRGEDTERIIFSPEDVISFSLEYADASDTDSISSKSSDSNDPQTVTTAARRYLQCPAVVNISHLKKFLSMKFDIDSTLFAIDILYKRVPLPDYYTLMDIAYIYNWKRNEPMRFFYQIIDYVAIRNIFFDINRKKTQIRDRKSSPTSTEDTSASSPAPQVNDKVSEASSGTDSPMPENNSSKQVNDSAKKTDNCSRLGEISGPHDNLQLKKTCHSSSKRNDDEVEKSQFLNSFELTAKSNSTSDKSSPIKTSIKESPLAAAEQLSKNETSTPKSKDTLKRKLQHLSNISEIKKKKIEHEKPKLPDKYLFSTAVSKGHKSNESSEISKETENLSKNADTTPPSKNKLLLATSGLIKDAKQQLSMLKQLQESPGAKRSDTTSQNISSPKIKVNNPATSVQESSSSTQRTVSPIKLQFSKSDPLSSLHSQPTDTHKSIAKKMPDLKPSVPLQQSLESKGPPPSKVRMDLLANNSDPTIDRSKILSQVKTSLSMLNQVPNTGDPLKSLFDSCKINIPSSLSITLTDQKQDPHNPAETATEQKKILSNKNMSVATSSTNALKVPSPPVRNYIEILKLPDTDPKKQNKHEAGPDNQSNKAETLTSQSKLSTKSSETSVKGPIPNLKPIADAKLGKQSATLCSYPITFQQTFEQQLQSLQSDKKPKLPKTKAQVPKLVPANPKTFNSVASKTSNSNNKLCSGGIIPPIENKSSIALDLTTPIHMQSQLTPHQSKAFETMQSKAFEIANLAKKQSLTSKGASPAIPHNFSRVPIRSIPSAAPLRFPSMANVNELRQEKSQGTSSQDTLSKSNLMKLTTSPLSSPNYQVPAYNSSSPIQPTPRQTRSPSSSPKLVIAEDKQTSNLEPNVNQSNQISSTQAANNNAPKSESLKIMPGPSKAGPTLLKPLPPTNKIIGIRQPMTPTVKPNPSPADFEYISAHHALLRRHMEVNAWLKAQRFMNNMAHHAQNDLNKDKQ